MSEIKRVLEGFLKSVADSMDDYLMVDGDNLTDILALYDQKQIRITIEVVENKRDRFRA